MKKPRSIQKFFRGDLVKIGSSEGRSYNGKLAVVMYEYAEQYESCGLPPRYSLLILPSGIEVSWFEQTSLTFVAEDGWKKLPKRHIMRRNKEARIARRG